MTSGPRGAGSPILGAGRTGAAGFTVLELLVVLALISVLSAIALVLYRDAIHKARVARAIAEIRAIEKLLARRELDTGALPQDLGAVGWNHPDPWGNPYQYLEFSSAARGGGDGRGGLPGRARKDRNLVPLNTTYDLYSLGPDGQSRAPLTARVSRDDIVRAADGAFVGVAAEY